MDKQLKPGIQRTGMRPITETISFNEALTLVQKETQPLNRTERLPIAEAEGRVIATDVTAKTDVPPFNRAAMDGYAVIADDTFGADQHKPRILKCIEKVLTGTIPTKSLKQGECIEIATGAPMPQGADAVVMVEGTERGQASEIRILTPVHPRQHVGRRAADIESGEIVLRREEQLTPSRIGALAAVGICEIEVFARPTVSLLSTGNEIIEPGQPLGPGQIYDINKYTLGAIIKSHGGIPIFHATVLDTWEDLNAAIDSNLDEDMIVFSGGSSVGEHDLILDVIKNKGEVLFHGVAVKPGKPTIFGKINAKPTLGMPGYPTSCLSNGYMLLAPIIRRLARLPRYKPVTICLPLAKRVISTTGRHQFYTVRIEKDFAMPVFKASGDITSMSSADGYFEIPAQTDIVEKGEIVEVKLF